MAPELWSVEGAGRGSDRDDQQRGRNGAARGAAAAPFRAVPPKEPGLPHLHIKVCWSAGLPRAFLNCFSAPQRSVEVPSEKAAPDPILLFKEVGDSTLVLQVAMSAPSASHSLSIHRGDDDDMMVQEEDLAMIREMPPMSSYVSKIRFWSTFAFVPTVFIFANYFLEGSRNGQIARLFVGASEFD